LFVIVILVAARIPQSHVFSRVSTTSTLTTTLRDADGVVEILHACPTVIIQSVFLARRGLLNRTPESTVVPLVSGLEWCDACSSHRQLQMLASESAKVKRQKQIPAASIATPDIGGLH